MFWDTWAWKVFVQWFPQSAMAPADTWSRRWPPDRQWARLHVQWRLYWRRRRRWRSGLLWIRYGNQYLQVP